MMKKVQKGGGEPYIKGKGRPNFAIDQPGGNKGAGVQTQMWDYVANANQNIRYDNSNQRINLPGNLCLDVWGGGTGNGTRVVQWPCHGGANQKWVKYGTSLRPAHAQNKCLDVYGGQTHNGAKLIIWDCHGGANQQWEASDGSTLTANTSAILGEHCGKGQGWQKYLEGVGTFIRDQHFPGDASFITITKGYTADIHATNGAVQTVKGPNDFNFCSRAGFNDAVQKIVITKRVALQQSTTIVPIRYIRIIPDGSECIQIAQLAVYGLDDPSVNLATTGIASAPNQWNWQSPAHNAIDGVLSSRSFPNIYHSTCGPNDSWQLDLQDEYPVNKIVYYNRQDCCNDRAENLIMVLLDYDGAEVWRGNFTSEAMVQTFNFTVNLNITDPYRFLPPEQKCDGYENQSKSASKHYVKNYYKTLMSETCMPYYTGEVKTCKAKEAVTIRELNGKIDKCASRLHPCQESFNMNIKNSIISASYGSENANEFMDVKPILDAKIANNKSQILVSNATFGRDPSPGNPKTLYLTLSTTFGTNLTYEIPEGRPVDVDRPNVVPNGKKNNRPPPTVNNAGNPTGNFTFSVLGQQKGGEGGQPDIPLPQALPPPPSGRQSHPKMPETPQHGGWAAANDDVFNVPVPNFLQKIEDVIYPPLKPDNNPLCMSWAQRTPSACAIDPTFMNANCQTSCDAVKTPRDLQGEERHKYGIARHREFTGFQKKYIPLSQCPDKKYVLKESVRPIYVKTLNLISKLNDLKSNFKTDIRSHPDYSLLMDKYSIKDNDGNYQPCEKCV